MTYNELNKKYRSLLRRHQYLMADYARLKTAYISDSDLKEMVALQQHLIYELVKNGGKICKGYETINIVLPQLDEIRTTNVQTVQASD